MMTTSTTLKSCCWCFTAFWLLSAYLLRCSCYYCLHCVCVAELEPAGESRERKGEEDVLRFCLCLGSSRSLELPPLTKLTPPFWLLHFMNHTSSGVPCYCGIDIDDGGNISNVLMFECSAPRPLQFLSTLSRSMRLQLPSSKLAEPSYWQFSWFEPNLHLHSM